MLESFGRGAAVGSTGEAAWGLDGIGSDVDGDDC
jgi:hypothetical protein